MTWSPQALVKSDMHSCTTFRTPWGYGAVSYLRLENNNKEVLHVAFRIGKPSVAPLKQMTIPRMELIAAVLAVRVDTMKPKELQLQLDKSILWTDQQRNQMLPNICSKQDLFCKGCYWCITMLAQRKIRLMKPLDININSRPLFKLHEGPEFLCKPDREGLTPHLESAISAYDPEIRHHNERHFQKSI